MAQPVWVLSVDLQTKTATFQSGLADAAKAARTSFRDISSSAGEMGEGVSKGSIDIRHSLGLVDNVIRGAHAQAMADLIRMYAQSALVMTALPIAATAAGFALIGGIVYEVAEKMRAAHDAQEKLSDAQTKFGTTVNQVFDGLDQKLLEAGIRADELRNDHLAALKKQLELINMQSMDELAHTFETVAKAADGAFAEIQTHWYNFGHGAERAQHELTEFQLQYESLLAQHKSGEASDLLSGTLASAQRILQLQQQAAANKNSTNLAGFDQSGDHAKYTQAFQALAAAHRGYTDAEVAGQKQLVAALQAQLDVEGRISKLRGMDSANASTSASKATGNDRSKQMMDSLGDAQKQWEQEQTLREAASRQAIQEETRKEDALISLTREGTVGRLQAIRDAMDQEESLGLTETEHYTELLKQRNALAEQLDMEAQEQRATLAREDIDNTLKMGMLRIAAETQSREASESARRVSAAQRMAEETKTANEEYDLKMQALEKETAALMKSDKDYLTKLRQLQDQEKQLIQQHANDVAAIQQKGQKQSDQTMESEIDRFDSAVASSLTKTLMGKQSWSKMMVSLGDQMVSGMMQNVLEIMMGDKMTQLSNAKAAAAAAFSTGEKIGGPAGPVLGPIFAAAAFAGVMAFESGGIVPGTGRGDIVPAMLTPGEAVIPKRMTEMLTNAASSDSAGSGEHIHIHGIRYAPTVHALDSDGVDKVLTKHAATFQRHFEQSLRRMNR